MGNSNTQREPFAGARLAWPLRGRWTHLDPQGSGQIRMFARGSLVMWELLSRLHAGDWGW